MVVFPYVAVHMFIFCNVEENLKISYYHGFIFTLCSWMSSNICQKLTMTRFAFLPFSSRIISLFKHIIK